MKNPLFALHQQLSTSEIDGRNILLLRFLSIICQSVVILFAYYAFELTLNYSVLLWVVFIEIIINILFAIRLKSQVTISTPMFVTQLSIDIVFLTVLLYFSGGATNPFVSLFLVPIAIAAATMSRRIVWIMSIVCILIYSMLMNYFQPLTTHHSNHNQLFNLHLLGMWVNFIISALLIAFFVLSMARSLRAREKQMNQQREEALRNEKIISVGALAANAAHELGTPLTTLSMLSVSLREKFKNNKDIKLLAEQINRCQTVVQDLGKDAGAILNHQTYSENILLLCQHLCDQMRLLCPEVSVTFQSDLQSDSPLKELSITVDKTLQQSLLTLLTNAAQASVAANKNSIEFNVTLESNQIIFRIRDFGKGVDKLIKDKIGVTQVTDKLHGLGIGLFLANATIERYNGQISITAHKTIGTLTRVSLPLSGIIQRD